MSKMKTKIDNKIHLDSSVETKEALLTFLKKTKEGEYTKVDPSVVAQPRIKEVVEVYANEDQDDFYFYSTT